MGRPLTENGRSGIYVLRHDLHLATPQPHPSETLTSSQNPLATAVYPPRAGTRISLASIAPRKTLVRQFREINHLQHAPSHLSHSTGLRDVHRKDRDSGDSEKIEGGSDQSSTQPSIEAGTGQSGSENGLAPAFGENNALLTVSPSKDSNKRRKPKNNMVKSNSSFVSRVVPHEHMAKRLQDRSPDGVLAFANISRAFQWLDMSAANPVGVADMFNVANLLTMGQAEFLTKLIFTKEHALCHEANPVTRSSTNIDLVVGFTSGDIIWYEPISQKYARLNKNVGRSAIDLSTRAQITLISF